MAACLVYWTDDLTQIPSLPDVLDGLRSYFSDLVLDPAKHHGSSSTTRYLFGRPERMFVVDKEDVVTLRFVGSLSKSSFTSESGRVLSRMRIFGSFVDPSSRPDGKRVLYSVFGVMTRVWMPSDPSSNSDPEELSEEDDFLIEPSVDSEKPEETLSDPDFHSLWQERIAADPSLETELRAVIPGIMERLKREPWCRGDPLIFPYFKFFACRDVPEELTKVSVVIPFLPLSVFDPLTSTMQPLGVDIGPWSVNDETKIQRPAPTAFPPMFGLITKLSDAPNSILLGVGAWIHPNDQPASGFRATFKWALQRMKGAINSIGSDILSCKLSRPSTFEVETSSIPNVSDDALSIGMSSRFVPISENRVIYRGPSRPDASVVPSTSSVPEHDISSDEERDDDGDDEGDDTDDGEKNISNSSSIVGVKKERDNGLYPSVPSRQEHSDRPMPSSVSSDSDSDGDTNFPSDSPESLQPESSFGSTIVTPFDNNQGLSNSSSTSRLHSEGWILILILPFLSFCLFLFLVSSHSLAHIILFFFFYVSFLER